MAGQVDLKRIDAGNLRHPVYGNRGAWVSQRVRPGFWSKTLEDKAPDKVREALLEVLDDVERQLSKG